MELPGCVVSTAGHLGYDVAANETPIHIALGVGVPDDAGFKENIAAFVKLNDPRLNGKLKPGSQLKAGTWLQFTPELEAAYERQKAERATANAAAKAPSLASAASAARAGVWRSSGRMARSRTSRCLSRSTSAGSTRATRRAPRP